MVDVYAIKINKNLSTSDFNRLMSFLPKEKRDKIRKFLKYEDSLRSLLGDILVRNILSSKLKISNEKLVFSKNEYGKPYLKNSDEIYFNISHSGEWVVCAFDDSDIGIDIEKIYPIDYDGIAKSFFSPKECKDLYAKLESERLSYFYDLWTLKESYIKSDGRGLSAPLDSFSIRIVNNSIIVETKELLKDCFFGQYDIDSNYKMAICTSKKEMPQGVTIKKIDDLY